MAVKTVAPGVHIISLGFVNAVVLEDATGPILVDTGMPDSADKIIEGLEVIGHTPGDVQKIILTHKHIDHTGSLAVLKRATKAPALMHAIDAASVRKGEAMLPVKPAPGLFSKMMAASMRMFSADLAPVEIEEEVQNGNKLPLAGGIEVIHTPGHSAGHISLFLPRDGGILIVGDAAINVLGLRFPPIFEDMAAGITSLQRLSSLQFDTAVFMHGKPLNDAASNTFSNRWTPISSA
jgi:glyoxylase-like metal-dependent hydrolase (beta-lactamase superfamily II)